MLYPKLTELISLKSKAKKITLNLSSNTMTSGDYNSILRGMGMEFDSIRPYGFGDDVRHIDWKVTARTSKPYVKTHQATFDREALLIVDSNPYMQFGTRNTFKSIQAARVAALLGWSIVLNQDKFSSLAFGGGEQHRYTQASKSTKSLLKLFNGLCTKQQSDVSVELSDCLGDMGKLIKPNNLVFIISDFYQSNFMDLSCTLKKLASKCKVVLLYIYDVADHQLPEHGILNLAYQDQQMAVNCNDKQMRSRYYQNWCEFNLNLNNLCRKMAVLKIDIATNDDITNKIKKELFYAR